MSSPTPTLPADPSLFTPRDVGPDEVRWMLRRNIWTGMLGAVAVGFMSNGVFFTAYCKLQGVEPYQFGILRTLLATSGLLMLLSPHVQELVGQRKLPWFVLSIASRTCMVPLAFGLLFGITPWVIIALCAARAAFGNMAHPLFQSWCWDYIPSDRFTHFWARRQFWVRIGTFTFGLSAAALMRCLKDQGGGEDLQRDLLTGIFCGLLVLGFVDLLFHVRIPEPPRKARPSRSWAKITEAFRSAPFRNWLLASFLWTFSAMLSGSFTVPYAIYEAGFENHIEDLTLLMVGVTSVCAMTVLPVWSLLMARRPAPLLTVCCVFWAMIPLCVYLVPPDDLYTAFLLFGAAWALGGTFAAGVQVARPFMTKQLAGADKTMPAAIFWLALFAGQVSGSAVGTVIVKYHGMRPVFFVGVAARLATAVVTFLLLVYVPWREKRRHNVAA